MFSFPWNQYILKDFLEDWHIVSMENFLLWILWIGCMNIVCSKEIENSFRNASNRIRHNNIFNLCDRFFHAHLGKHASMFSSSDMTNQAANCSLRVGHDGTAGEDNGCNAFKLLYLDKQLPKYVAFKADNGIYVSQRAAQRELHLSGIFIRRYRRSNSDEYYVQQWRGWNYPYKI